MGTEPTGCCTDLEEVKSSCMPLNQDQCWDAERTSSFFSLGGQKCSLRAQLTAEDELHAQVQNSNSQ